MATYVFRTLKQKMLVILNDHDEVNLTHVTRSLEKTCCSSAVPKSCCNVVLTTNKRRHSDNGRTILDTLEDSCELASILQLIKEQI